MKLKVSVVLVVLVGLLLSASLASAHVLPLAVAKRYIAQETSRTCAEVSGCKSWSVKPCRRQSYHRVDCLANFFFPEGNDCQAVMIARVPSGSYTVHIHHKRIIC
jgi:hypothetical protein